MLRKPTVLSSALAIAGNTIGAGLLALPAVTQAAGFTAASTALTAGCVFSMITGLLIAEINIAMLQNSSSAGKQEGASEKRLTLVSMAGTMLGSGATFLTSGVYLFRSYALMQAYTSRAGSLISRVVHLPLLPSAIIFAAGGALVCAVTSSRQLDRITSGLVITMLASFAMGSPAIGPALQLFSLLTLSTSFLGYVQSLTDFLSDILGLQRGPPGQRSLIPYVLAVIPPVALTMAFPDAFVSSLSLAGTYGAMVLFGLIPAAMAWSYRYGTPPNFPVSEAQREQQRSSDVVMNSLSDSMDMYASMSSQDSMDMYSSTSSQGSIDMAPSETASQQGMLSQAGGSSSGGLEQRSQAVLSGGASRLLSYGQREKVEEMVPGGMATLLLVAGMAGGVIANQLYETFGS
ncbi:MAG: hypothetical protein WDW38_005209 [Sanguina aurantia]